MPQENVKSAVSPCLMENSTISKLSIIILLLFTISLVHSEIASGGKWLKTNKQKTKQNGYHHHTFCLPFLTVPAAELVPNFWAPRLAQQDLDEEALLLVVRDHHLLCIGWDRGSVPDGPMPESVLRHSVRKAF